MTIEEIREESRRRNAGDVAQGYVWGVVIPALLAEVDRLRAAEQSLRASPIIKPSTNQHRLLI